VNTRKPEPSKDTPTDVTEKREIVGSVAKPEKAGGEMDTS